MKTYILRRLLLIIPTLFFVSIIVFCLIRFVPGDIIDMMLMEQNVYDYELTRAEIEHRLGLDEPIYVQYGRWLGVIPDEDGKIEGILEGSLGKSLWTDTPIIPDLFRRLPVTFELGIIAITLSLIVAIPIGIYSAIRQDTAGDYIARSLAIIFIAVPPFWIATVVIVLPSIMIGWSPPTEYVPFFEDPIANLNIIILPAVIMALGHTGMVMRMTRTMMLEVLRGDYIRTAWAKGIRERTVIYRHALKNALIPVVTIIGLQLPMLISGSVIIEQIFNIPGVGRYLINVIGNRDYPAISGINLFIATMVLVINLLTDMTYAYLDPRVHYK